jgi:terminase small subunit / prophage DNA-packing protein
MGKVVNKHDLSEILGISERTLTVWQRQGLPMSPRGVRGEPNVYDVPKVIRWWLRREVHKVQDEQPRDRLARVQADKVELELAEKRGELIPKAAIRPAWLGFVVATRQALRALPAGLAPVLAQLEGADPIRDLLEEAIDEALTKLATDENDKPGAKRVAARSARALGAAAEDAAVGVGGAVSQAAGGVGNSGRISVRDNAVPTRDR